MTRTTTQIIQSSDLLNWLEAFIMDRRSTRLSEFIIKYYRVGLTSFFNFCSESGVSKVNQINAVLIRRYLLYFENTGHNPGGVHAKYRTVIAFFNWYEVEIY